MDRRADLIVMAAVTAAAVVPAAIVAIVKAGPDAPRKPVAAVQNNPAQAPAPETAGASRTPRPGHGSGATPAAPTGSAPATSPSTPGRASRAGGTNTPTKKNTPSAIAPLRSYVRVTEVRLSGAPNGDYEHITETARFTLAPRFALDATGVRTRVRDGKKTTLTQKVIVKGRTLSGFDGAQWSRSTLTDDQLTKLRTGSDPREFTGLMRSLPGVSRSAPDGFGAVHYTAGTSIGALLGVLPASGRTAAERALKAVPPGVGVTLDLWANTEDRPTWIGLGAAAPAARFTGSMTFQSYR